MNSSLELKPRMDLSYEVTLSGSGKRVGVYNEKISGGIVEKYVGPFDTIEECKQYCDEYTEATRMGYNGRASLTYLNGNHYAFCSRWTSCD